MKRLFAIVIMALSLFIACTPEDDINNGGGGQNNKDELTVTGEALEVTDYSATLTGFANLPIELGDAEVGIMYDKQQSFENVRKVVATGLDGNNKFTVSVTGLEPSTTYYFKSYVQNGMAVKHGAVKSFTTKELTIPAGAVDLGIVMTRADGTTYRLYWAKSNLRVNGLCANPEDHGDYYAWGETEPYYEIMNPTVWLQGKEKGYSWESYKWAELRTYSSGYSSEVRLFLTKYCPFISFWAGDGQPDDKTVLETGPEGDDAASKTLGEKWREPTKEEWWALLEQCTFTSTTHNGINGLLVTASNGNNIFLPGSGGVVSNNVGSDNVKGLYWSSSLDSSKPMCAWALDFFSDSARGPTTLLTTDRYYGYSIRPVYEE